jgi:hypothetical protein
MVLLPALEAFCREKLRILNVPLIDSLSLTRKVCVCNLRSVFGFRMNKNIYLLLLSTSTVFALCVTACTTNGIGKGKQTEDYVQIKPRVYNPQTRGFDRPWPFGPESAAQ